MLLSTPVMSQQSQIIDTTEVNPPGNLRRDSMITTTKRPQGKETPRVHRRKRLHNPQAGKGKFAFFIATLSHTLTN